MVGWWDTDHHPCSVGQTQKVSVVSHKEKSAPVSRDPYTAAEVSADSHIQTLTDEEYEAFLSRAQSLVSIEATVQWDRVDALHEGRDLFEGSRHLWTDGHYEAVLTLKSYETHRVPFLWSRGGPVWNERFPASVERRMVDDLAAYVKKSRSDATFLRIVASPQAQCLPCSEAVAYDRTVMLDLKGDEDSDVLARMKKRGRRDVRKALREIDQSAIHTYTSLSAEEFRSLVEIMNNLGSAEHFATFTGDYYHDFLTALAQGDAATLITYAPEGQSSAWLMMTHAYGLATYYFAAATPQAKRELAPDALVWKMIQVARERKCHTLDLMGIGSEDAPQFAHLDTFKTKFAAEPTQVWTYGEIPINTLRYRLVLRLTELRDQLARIRTVMRHAPRQ